MAVFQVPITGFHQGNKHSKKMPELGGQEVFSFLLLGPGLFLILNPLFSLFVEFFTVLGIRSEVVINTLKKVV